MNSPTLILVLSLIATPAFASGGRSYTQKPDLKECEPYKPKFKEVKKSIDLSDDWGVAIDDAKKEKEEFKVVCEEVKSAPNAPGAIPKFISKKNMVLEKYKLLKAKKLATKKQFEKVYKPLKDLDEVICHDKVKKGYEIVEKESKEEEDSLKEICKDMPVGNTRSVAGR